MILSAVRSIYIHPVADGSYKGIHRGLNMTYRPLSKEQTLLRIYIGESDKHDHKPLAEFIIAEARKQKLAGCTIFKGTTGFGAGGLIHSDFPPDYAENLPIIIELVDTDHHLFPFLESIEPHLQGVLVTEEKLHVHQYRPRNVSAKKKEVKGS